MFGLKSLAKKRKRLKKHNSSASWGGGIDPGTLTINLFLASADSYGFVSIWANLHHQAFVKGFWFLELFIWAYGVLMPDLIWSLQTPSLVSLCCLCDLGRPHQHAGMFEKPGSKASIELWNLSPGNSWILGLFFFMVFLWFTYDCHLWFFYDFSPPQKNHKKNHKKIIKKSYLWEFPWEYNAHDECYDFFMISRKFHEIPKENSKK